MVVSSNAVLRGHVVIRMSNGTTPTTIALHLVTNDVPNGGKVTRRTTNRVSAYQNVQIQVAYVGNDGIVVHGGASLGGNVHAALVGHRATMGVAATDAVVSGTVSGLATVIMGASAVNPTVDLTTHGTAILGDAHPNGMSGTTLGLATACTVATGIGIVAIGHRVLGLGTRATRIGKALHLHRRLGGSVIGIAQRASGPLVANGGLLANGLVEFVPQLRVGDVGFKRHQSDDDGELGKHVGPATVHVVTVHTIRVVAGAQRDLGENHLKGGPRGEVFVPDLVPLGAAGPCDGVVPLHYHDHREGYIPLLVRDSTTLSGMRFAPSDIAQ